MACEVMGGLHKALKTPATQPTLPSCNRTPERDDVRQSVVLLAEPGIRPAGLSRLTANLAQAPAAELFGSRASPNLAAFGGEFLSLRGRHALHTHLAADFPAQFAQGYGGRILLGHGQILPKICLTRPALFGNIPCA